jgi:hypothetical protein
LDDWHIGVLQEPTDCGALYILIVISFSVACVHAGRYACIKLGLSLQQEEPPYKLCLIARPSQVYDLMVVAETRNNVPKSNKLGNTCIAYVLEDCFLQSSKVD